MKIKEYSPITWAFERVFRGLQLLPPQVIVSLCCGERSDLPVELESDEQTAARAKKVEYFIIASCVFDSLGFAATFSTNSILLLVARIWAILRIIDILQQAINITLFEGLRKRTFNKVVSGPRLVLLSFVNFNELLLCFATIYASFISDLKGAETPWDALYFSVITQLTIGYGDITPVGALRIVAVCQALGGLTFLALVFARTINVLPPLSEKIQATPKDRNRLREP
jgi:hypothetical protein